MKKKKPTSFFRVFLLIAIVISSMIFVALFVKQSQDVRSRAASLILENPTSEPNNSIQLGTFQIVTTTPVPTNPPKKSTPNPTRKPTPKGPTVTKGPTATPRPTLTAYESCNIVVPTNMFVTIVPNPDGSPGCCVQDGVMWGKCCPGVPQINWPPYGAWCDAKPVIYLYPEKTTTVDVTLTIPGSVTVSDPLYGDGWKGIIAHPDGTLQYKGKTYSELYYETAITPIDPPKKGIVVKIEDIKKSLEEISTRLGLVDHEKNELVSFWTPRLERLNSPFVFISVFSNEQKQKIDKVTINPKPDTFIEFNLYFKPQTNRDGGSVFPFPTTIPSRIGFTAVEWGGIIDR